MTSRWMSRSLRSIACALPVLLAACGGGGDDGGPPQANCSVSGQQAWLRGYMNDWYFWYALSPNPSPVGYSGIDDYFNALLYGGGDPIPNGAGALWPGDRYSYYQSTSSFNSFWRDGETFGYGVAVNGLEAAAQGATRLYIRYVEPYSPASAAGLVRGDELLTINGTPVATLIAANNGEGDFSALTANQTGDVLRLSLRRASGSIVNVDLPAAVYKLAPVQGNQVLPSPNGRKLGYVFVKDMIDQIESPPPGGVSLASVMNGFRNQGVQDIVLDLRYNGGGLVSAGERVASYVAGSARAGQVFTSLLYNDRKASNNETFLFSNPGLWTGFGRVYVLMGERTCSASEQVINGLRGVGVNVIGVGGTSCGKPVGFLPQDDACGTTYSVVNFESVNRLNQGRYFDGLAPTCAVAEDFSRPIGGTGDPLLVAAAHHVDVGACPAGTARTEQPQARSSVARKRYSGADGGERVGMTVR